MKTKSKMNGYILRSSAAALLLSCAFLALCSAINLPNYPPRISTPKNNTALGVNGRQSASSVVAAPTTTCGNGVPCSCGDTVVADTTLSDQDPVTQTVCSGNGSVLASGIILDLNGYTMPGSRLW